MPAAAVCDTLCVRAQRPGERGGAAAAAGVGGYVPGASAANYSREHRLTSKTHLLSRT